MTTISIKVPVSYEFNEKLSRIQDKMRQNNGKMTSKAQILFNLAQKGLKNEQNSGENAQNYDKNEQKFSENAQNNYYLGHDFEQNSEISEQIAELNELKEQIYFQKDNLYNEKERLIAKEKEILKQKEELIIEKSEIKSKDTIIKLKDNEIIGLKNDIELLKQKHKAEIISAKSENENISSQFRKFEKFILHYFKQNNKGIQELGISLIEKASAKPEKNLLEKLEPLLPSALMFLTQFFTNNSDKVIPELEKLKDGITDIYGKINKNE